MWAAIGPRPAAASSASVHAENSRVAGSDPAALRMLVAGEIQFFTLMGGILGTVVPVAEMQQVPFAFARAADAHKAMDGELGASRRGDGGEGHHRISAGRFDNGMRQIAGVTRPIARPTISPACGCACPAGQMVADTFRRFGAEPVITSDGSMTALKSGRVDAQENPLALVDCSSSTKW